MLNNPIIMGGGSLPTLPNPGTAADLLMGKQLIDQNGNILSGSMANRGAVSQTLNAGESYTIPIGFHNGSGRITANSLSSQTSGTATAADITSGKTAWVNGNQLTGTAAGPVGGLSYKFALNPVVSEKRIVFDLSLPSSIGKKDLKFIYVANNLSYTNSGTNTKPVINTLLFSIFGESESAQIVTYEDLGPNNIVVGSLQQNSPSAYYSWSYSGEILTFTISSSTGAVFYTGTDTTHPYTAGVYY